VSRDDFFYRKDGKVAASVMMRKRARPKHQNVWYREREKKADPQNSRRKTPMQKSWLSEDAKTAVENAHFVRVENKPQPPSSEVGNTVSEIFFGWENTRYRLFFHRAVRECQKFVASKRKRHMSIKEFVQVGIAAKSRQVSSRIQSALENGRSLSPLPARGRRKKEIDACYFGCRCPPR
jgi:hypothetical protein